MTKNVIKSVNNDLFDQAYMEDLEERIETAPVATSQTMTKNVIKSVNNDLFDQAYMEDLEERIETAPVATSQQTQDFCSPICDFTCLVY